MARSLRREGVMRVAYLVLFFMLATGCGADTLDNTTYRRLVDQFDTYDQCLQTGMFAPCYQTLTFCADGHANANLDFRQEGSYQLQDSVAVAKLPSVTVFFDLDKASSPQLPGKHKWELVEPLSVDCK
jgi:hypothetical protein